MKDHKETHFNYRSVIISSELFRVIICKDNWQWIIQKRVGIRHGGPRWQAFCYSRSQKTLLKVWTGLHKDASKKSWPELENLPQTFKVRE